MRHARHAGRSRDGEARLLLCSIGNWYPSVIRHPSHARLSILSVNVSVNSPRMCVCVLAGVLSCWHAHVPPPATPSASVAGVLSRQAGRRYPVPGPRVSEYSSPRSTWKPRRPLGPTSRPSTNGWTPVMAPRRRQTPSSSPLAGPATRSSSTVRGWTNRMISSSSPRPCTLETA